MPRRRRSTTVILAALALALGAPAAAGADFQALFDDYRSDSVIDGCTYSPAELGAALNEIPADVRQYDPGYTEAINLALEQSTAGCDEKPATAGPRSQTIAADGSPGPKPPPAASLRTAGPGRDVPVALLALIFLLGGSLVAAGAYALGRRRAF
jgi:hypothetical protein